MNKATIKTSLGNIVIKLDAEKAPISVENFKQYASQGFFAETIFHRVMPGFMIQCGGFTKEAEQKKTNEPIKNEAKNGLKNNKGTIAMARTGVVDSATSQFFINLIDNDFLNYRDEANYGYAVFGEVTEGMDVVDKIAQVKTANKGGHQNWPVEDVIIESVELSE
ncbi:peptidyl-prolyl cis-trans isomerase [bacterium]|nr:peptidyl-prolyl cis-trans isomerase [bacterium]